MDELVADLRLMFANCRQFNEEGSMIYEDANRLEKAMNDKIRELCGGPVVEKKPAVKTFRVSGL